MNFANEILLNDPLTISKARIPSKESAGRIEYL